MHKSKLSLVRCFNGTYDVIETCECCGTSGVAVQNVKPTQLTHIKQTRDTLADCINMLSALLMNASLTEKQRIMILKQTVAADQVLDKADGLEWQVEKVST